MYDGPSLRLTVRRRNRSNAGKSSKSMIKSPIILPWKELSHSSWTDLLLIACLASVVLSGCRKTIPTIAVIPRTSGTLLWEAEHTGVEREAWGRDVYVYWTAPMREDDIQGQIDVLSRAIDRGSSGVIISPDAALPLRAPVYNALNRGIPVVVIGTDLDLSVGKNLAYVLNNEDTGGQLGARRVGALLKGHGTVAVLGMSNQLTSTAERARSLEQTLAREFPDIHVVFRSFALPNVSQEQQVAEKLLAKGPPVDVIVALTQNSTRGAYYALTEFDRIPATRLIGFDQDLLAPIHSGGIDSVILQNTYQMGREAMKLMDQEMHGGTGRTHVVVEPELVTREDIDSDRVRQMLDLSWFIK
jgi:ribose transport system substrate-binding protein